MMTCVLLSHTMQTGSPPRPCEFSKLSKSTATFEGLEQAPRRKLPIASCT